MNNLYLYGSGGHSKVVADIANLLNYEISGMIDDDPNIWGADFYGNHVIGGKSSLEQVKKHSNFHISIGNNKVRKKIADLLTGKDFKLKSLIHPHAVISPSVTIAEGTAVMAGAIINADSTIGENCIINTNSSIDHDCLISAYVHISPGVTLCGNVRIGEQTLIGAGARIIPGVSVGKNCTVGAGSVVLSNIPDNTRVVGIPARCISN